MNHLTTETLNMYLDGALDRRERAAADRHLAICEACQRELAALRELFGALEALPAAPLPADLTSQVLGRIAPASEPRAENRPPARLRRYLTPLRERPSFAAALVLQIALAAALAVWLAPQLVGAASVSLAALRFPALPDLAAALVGLVRTGGAMSVVPVVALSAAQWTLLLVGVGVVWFISNRFLLVGSSERRGNHQEAA